jgi:putative hydrolase of the HAD superfamily
MGIKAVAFDFGNVISQPQDASTMELMGVIGDISEADARRIVFDGRDDWDRGSVAGPEFFRRGFAALGKDPDEGVLQAFMRADLESWTNLDEGTLALIDGVKAAGLKTAILSNMPHEFVGTARKRFPFFGAVDAAVLSCEHGVIKPEPAIFAILLEKLALSGPEVVFFDDIEKNVQAARTAGIQAFLWKGADAARGTLRDLGVGV